MSLKTNGLKNMFHINFKNDDWSIHNLSRDEKIF